MTTQSLYLLEKVTTEQDSGWHSVTADGGEIFFAVPDESDDVSFSLQFRNALPDSTTTVMTHAAGFSRFIGKSVKARKGEFFRIVMISEPADGKYFSIYAHGDIQP